MLFPDLDEDTIFVHRTDPKELLGVFSEHPIELEGKTWPWLFFLPRIVGFQRASALMITGDKVGAKEAQEMGMVYKVLPAEGFEDACFEFSSKIAAMPTYGIGLTKRALNASYGNDLTGQLALEDELQTLAGNSYDYNEGVSAFLEKRKPEFKGK